MSDCSGEMVRKPLDCMRLGTRWGWSPNLAARSSYRVFWLSGGQAGQPNLQTGTFCAGNEVRPAWFLKVMGGHRHYIHGQWPFSFFLMCIFRWLMIINPFWIDDLKLTHQSRLLWRIVKPSAGDVDLACLANQSTQLVEGLCMDWSCQHPANVLWFFTSVMSPFHAYFLIFSVALLNHLIHIKIWFDYPITIQSQMIND